MLTLKKLKETKPGAVIASGQSFDNEDGLHLARTNKLLQWVAVRGHGEADWAIYAHHADYSIQYIKRHGDKVAYDSNIQRCVPCDDEALANYRR